MISVTNIHKMRLIQQSAIAVGNMQESAHREAAYFIKLATGELVDSETKQPVSVGEINTRIGNWLKALDKVRRDLRHFRDVTLANYPDIIELAALQGLSPDDLEIPGQEIGDLLDEFRFKMGFTEEQLVDREDRTAAEIIEHCLWLQSVVPLPLSVWSEQGIQ